MNGYVPLTRRPGLNYPLSDVTNRSIEEIGQQLAAILDDGRFLVDTGEIDCGVPLVKYRAKVLLSLVGISPSALDRDLKEDSQLSKFVFLEGMNPDGLLKSFQLERLLEWYGGGKGPVKKQVAIARRFYQVDGGFLSLRLDAPMMRFWLRG